LTEQEQTEAKRKRAHAGRNVAQTVQRRIGRRAVGPGHVVTLPAPEEDQHGDGDRESAGAAGKIVDHR
jgi:hypothetical protein